MQMQLFYCVFGPIGAFLRVTAKNDKSRLGMGGSCRYDYECLDYNLPARVHLFRFERAIRLP